jgi:BirA family biotin operon repressor/biotin-[acetyl-CoA-carboxylase] ligase
MNITILRFDTIDSTNTEALKQVRAGADEGLCVVARQQTAGRGRHGREWVSEKDAGLYFSIVLKPTIDIRFLPLTTLLAGVAVHATLADTGLLPDIKWVNDILVNEKKIAGILAETTDTPDGLAVVVGVGVNLRSTNFSAELAATATSIEEAGGVITFDIIDRLTGHVAHFYEQLGKSDGPAAIIDEWRQRSTYFSGKRVRVAVGSDLLTGVTDGLEANGALRLRKDDGAVALVQTGDVERLRAEAD